MKLDLTGKIAVVTGGAGHLGKAMSHALREAGATVIVASREGEVKLDISSMESVEKCFSQILEKHGKIDILVNNAFFCPSDNLETMSEEDWVKGIDGTLNSVFRCTKAVLPTMTGQGSGVIINISSMYGMVSPDPRIYGDSGYNNPPSYGAGKAGIIHFTKFCACQLAEKGIRVNSISPGPFPNPDVQKNSAFVDELCTRVPMGRIGQPEELGPLVVFLASDASSYITGANIPVDGGWTAW